MNLSRQWVIVSGMSHSVCLAAVVAKLTPHRRAIEIAGVKQFIRPHRRVDRCLIAVLVDQEFGRTVDVDAPHCNSG